MKRYATVQESLIVIFGWRSVAGTSFQDKPNLAIFRHILSTVKIENAFVAVCKWWRWGELNPRPKTFSQEVYMLSKGLLS